MLFDKLVQMFIRRVCSDLHSLQLCMGDEAHPYPSLPTSGYNTKNYFNFCQYDKIKQLAFFLFLSFFPYLLIYFEREREREKEREREHAWGRGREREGERESPSRLHTVSAEPDMGLELMNSEIMN